jgi:hypothetical protein
MPKPYPDDLRECVIEAVEAGASRTEATRGQPIHSKKEAGRPLEGRSTLRRAPGSHARSVP